MTRRRINANNEDLIGAHYRLPGSIVPMVVDDVDPDREGVLRAINTHSNLYGDVDAYEVRAAVNARAARLAAAIARKAAP